jgi:polysaccharide export outer membrane protein
MRSTWTAVAALVLVSGMAWAQDAPAQPAATPDSAKAASDKVAADKAVADKGTNAVPASQAGPDYVIGPEDVVHVQVWKENDLTATLPVRPDGKISLPLLNDVQAAGLTPEQLAQSLTEKLKKYIADPRVTVVVTAINSKRIYLIGEVLHTGGMPLLPNMTVLQALSSAGLNQFAKTKGIYVLRTVNGKQEKLAVNYRKLVKGQEIDENYVLQSGDTIVIP